MEIGKTYFGKYKIIREIGQGGFGRVYLAEEGYGRQVAIKTLRQELPDDDKAEARTRFDREIRIGLKLDHPHILKAHTYEQDDEIYLVMDYMPKGSLADWLEAFKGKGQLPTPDDAMTYTRQICQALNYLHNYERRGYVHRDVTPNNILIDVDGNARLMDFGLIQEPGESSLLASRGRISSQPGTPQYQSPEARAGESILLATSDVYMLGAVLFELLTGWAYIHKQGIAPGQLNPDIPKKLDTIILKAVAENPKERYQTAIEFSKALANVMTQPTKPVWLMPAIAIGLMLLLGAGGWGIAKTRQSAMATQITPATIVATKVVAPSITSTSTSNILLLSSVTPKFATHIPESPIPTFTRTPLPKPTATKTTTPKPSATKTNTPKPTATNTPTKTPKPTFLIENFENYNLDSLRHTYHINAAWEANEGSLGLSGPPHIGGGNQALSFNYNIRNSAPNDYSGFEKDFEPQNWSKYSSFCFWIQNDNANRDLVIQFKESNGEAWKYITSLSNTEGYNCIPFSNFIYADWSQSENNQIDLSAINYYSLFIEGQQGVGIIYLDNVYLQ